jgi:hypothetical protein
MKLKTVKTGITANIAPTNKALTTVKDVNCDIIGITRQIRHLRTIGIKVIFAQSRKQIISGIIGTIVTAGKVFHVHINPHLSTLTIVANAPRIES